MSGRVVLFVGPTMPGVNRFDDVEVRAPAAHGDVYAAARDGASTIVLVDGVFDWVRSVWHKEILWALEAGVRVIGAASMGALRAAECAAFGMEPCGVIAQDYLHGRRTRDGDVAVAHGSAEDGWRPLSEALVNVDATLDAAEVAGVIGHLDAERLRGAALRCFYADRVWPKVIADAGLVEVDPRLLRSWLGANAVDQKRIDAELAVAEALGAERTSSPRFELAASSFWRRAAAAVDDTRSAVRPRARAVDLDQLLD